MVALCLGLGCLPTGDPPLGQHIVADRTLAAVFLTPSGIDGAPPNLLAAGPVKSVGSQGASGFDLYRFDYLSRSQLACGLTGLPATVADVIAEEGVTQASYIPQTDHRGRLVYVKPAAPESDASKVVARFDFATGRDEDLASPGWEKAAFLLSASHSRIFAGGSIFDDDGATQVGPLSTAEPAFVDDDLYYGTVLYGGTGVVGSTISRSRTKAATETLLSSMGMVKFLPIRSDVAAQLMVSWSSEAGDVPYLLLDTRHMASAPLPAQRGQAQFQSASSDGHWLAFQEPTAGGGNRLFLFDWTMGSYETSDSSTVPIGTENDWRPGLHELWIGLSGKGLAIWNPAGGWLHGDPKLVPAKLTFGLDGRTSMFTRDGAHCFSVESSQVGEVAKTTYYVGSADEPTAPRLALNPNQQFRSIWESDDGRLLVGATTFDQNRQNIYLVDPKAGSSRVIASGGHVVAVGRTRALALLNWQLASSTGDLTLIDLDTGANTVIARDVYQLAVDPQAFADPSANTEHLASGTRIAFLSRNRLVSPYDGLWVASLP